MSFVVPDRADWCLPELVARRGEELGDTPFLSFALDGGEVSYGAAAEAARAVAGGLGRLGVARGERVLMMLRNRSEFALAMLGVSEAGGIQVPVNVDYRGPFLEHLVNTSEAATLIVEDELLDAVAASLGSLPGLRSVVVVGDPVDLGPRVRVSSLAELLAAEPAAARPRSRASDPAAIHFTSGTSGRSKGALLPHAAVHLLAERNRELLDLRAGDAYLTELPLFHINAQMSLYSSLLVGARLRVERRFSAGAWLERIRAAGATHTSLLGVMLGFVLAQPERPDDADNTLRSAWTVPCPAGPALTFRGRFGLERIVTSYGSTEIGMVTHRIVGEGPDVSAGRVADDLYDVRVVDEYDEEVPEGEVGELIVRPRLPWTTTLGYVGHARCGVHRLPQPLVPHRRRGQARRRAQPDLRRPLRRPHPAARRERRVGRRRGRARRPPRRRRGGGRRGAGGRGGRRGRDQGGRGRRARRRARRRVGVGLVRRAAAVLRRPALRRARARAAQDADVEGAEERAACGGRRRHDRRPRGAARGGGRR